MSWDGDVKKVICLKLDIPKQRMGVLQTNF